MMFRLLSNPSLFVLLTGLAFMVYINIDDEGREFVPDFGRFIIM